MPPFPQSPKSHISYLTNMSGLSVQGGMKFCIILHYFFMPSGEITEALIA